MKSLEIFSGTGGLAKGLEFAGFEHASFVEFNRQACLSLRRNFDPDIVYEGDIAEFDLSALPNIDIVAGGPPCQPFSLGGKHKAHHDRRDMFPYAIRCIEHLRPKAFIFENVKGLLRASFADYFDYIILRLTFPDSRVLSHEGWPQHLERLRKLRKKKHNNFCYKVYFRLLNAADYGIPQKRERVVIVGIRSDLDLNWSFPESTHTEDRLNWDQFVTGEYWNRHNVPRQENHFVAASLKKKYGFFPPLERPWRTVRDALVGVPHPQGQHGIPDHIYKSGAKIYPGHTGSKIDKPSKTIKAGVHGVPGGENMIRYEDGSVRYLTTYEAKLIQTFPKDFIVTGAWSESMRQLGNAVPVQLAEIIGQRLFSLLASKRVNRSFHWPNERVSCDTVCA